MSQTPPGSVAVDTARRLRRLTRRAAKWSAWRVGALPALERVLSAAGDPERLLILTYHHVSAGGADARPNPFEVGVPAPEFERQLQLLNSRWRAIDLGEAVARWASGRPLPARAVCLTFDDGYRDVYDNAYPLLTKHGVPATVFVSSGLVGSPTVPWWMQLAHLVMTSARQEVKLHALPAGPSGPVTGEIVLPLATRAQRLSALTALNEAMKYVPATAHSALLADLAAAFEVDAPERQPDLWMDAHQVRELSDNGVAIGCHTVTHANLALLAAEHQQEELSASKRRLREIVERPIDLLSYPFGLFNADSRRIAAQEFAAACCSESGVNRPETDRFALRRVSIGWHRLWDFAFTLAFADGTLTTGATQP